MVSHKTLFLTLALVAAAAAVQAASPPSPEITPAFQRRQNGCSEGNIIGNKLQPASGCGSDADNSAIDASILSQYSAQGQTIELDTSARGNQGGPVTIGNNVYGGGGSGNIEGGSNIGPISAGSSGVTSEGGNVIEGGSGGVSVSKSLENGTGVIVSASGDMTTTISVGGGGSSTSSPSVVTSSGQNGALSSFASSSVTLYSTVCAVSAVAYFAILG